MSVESSALRNDLDVDRYLTDVLRRLLESCTDDRSLLPHTWRAAHPEAVRKYREEERRDASERQRHRREERRKHKPLTATSPPRSRRRSCAEPKRSSWRSAPNEPPAVPPPRRSPSPREAPDLGGSPPLHCRNPADPHARQTGGGACVWSLLSRNSPIVESIQHLHRILGDRPCCDIRLKAILQKLPIGHG